MKFASSNWHLVRVLQLALGLSLTGSYFFYFPDGITLAIGLVLLIQAAFNISCPLGHCRVPVSESQPPRRNSAGDEVVYEELEL